jgi:hypothetical protein
VKHLLALRKGGCQVVWGLLRRVERVYFGPTQAKTWRGAYTYDGAISRPGTLLTSSRASPSNTA